MRRRLTGLLTIAACATVVTGVAVRSSQAQGPGPAPRAAPASTGIIAGQTVDGATGRPVSGAHVALNLVPGGLGSLATGGDSIPFDQLMSLDFASVFSGMNQVIADSQGRFAFTGLPQGAFSLQATKPGWAGGGYGQRRPDGTSAPFVLADADHVGNVTLQLWKNATLGGTVVDEAGEPIVGLMVRALRRTWVAGRPRYSPAGTGQTDDRGFYRIAFLRPGEYVAVIAQTSVTTPASGAAPAMDPAALQGLIASGGADPDTLLANIRALTTAGPPSGIHVGDWVLQTSSFGGATVPPIVTGAGKMFAYRTTFYPTAVASSQAASITLGSGEERSGVDFQLTPVPVIRVSGTVTGPEGPVAGTGVRLLPAGTDDLSADSGFESATTTTDANGAFTFLAVPSGPYTLRVVRNPRAATPAPPAFAANMATIQNASGATTLSMGSLSMGGLMPIPPPIPAEPTLWASVPVSVGDSDLDRLAVPLKRGVRVGGRVEFEGTAARPTPDELRRIPIAVSRADAAGAFPTPVPVPGQGGQFDANGQFTSFSLLPGNYFVRVPFSFGAWTLKSAMRGGKNVADVPLEIASSDIGDVILTFTDRPTELSGTTHDARGVTDSQASVIVFPTNPDGWVDFGSGPRTLRIAKAEKDGRFRIAGLPAGAYFVAAMRDDISGDWQNPAFLQELSLTATRVAIGEGEKKVQDLQTPAR